MQYQARWSAKRTRFTGGARIQYPGDLFLINTESVTVAINDSAGGWIAFSQQRVAGGNGILFMAVDNYYGTTGHFHSIPLLQFVQTLFVFVGPFGGDIVVAPDEMYFPGFGLYGFHYMSIAHITGMNCNVALPDIFGDLGIKVSVSVGEDSDFLNHWLVNRISHEPAMRRLQLSKI
jgi:hypothetical protein